MDTALFCSVFSFSVLSLMPGERVYLSVPHLKGKKKTSKMPYFQGSQGKIVRADDGN